MDGFTPSDRIVVVGATNRMDLVDPAILRAGRFDIKVHIPLPTSHERKGIFKKLLERRTKSHEVDEDTIQMIGEKTQQWCGADLEFLLNESIYRVIKAKRDKICSEDVRLTLSELLAKK